MERLKIEQAWQGQCVHVCVLYTHPSQCGLTGGM